MIEFMEQYINKSALVAEIERMMAEEMALFEESLKDDSHEISAAPVVYTRLQMLLSSINTLEVKEVDLEKYYHNFLQKEWFGKNCNRTISEMIAFTAEHFFELGLKAQKGE